MKNLGLCPLMERNNQAAAHILRKEYAEGMEKLEGALRQLKSHVERVSKRSPGGDLGSIESENCSLDEWMLPAMEALHDGGTGSSSSGGGSSSSFFVYRKPLVVPSLHICRARSIDRSFRANKS